MREQSDHADGYAMHAFLGEPIPLSSSDYASSDDAYAALSDLVGNVGGKIGSRVFTNHFPMRALDGHLQTLVCVEINVPEKYMPAAKKYFRENGAPYYVSYPHAIDSNGKPWTFESKDRRIEMSDGPWLKAVKEICSFGWHSPASYPNMSIGCCTLMPMFSEVIPNGFSFSAYLQNDFPSAEVDFSASENVYADIIEVAKRAGATVGERFHKTLKGATHTFCPINVPKGHVEDFAQIGNVSRIALWPDLEDSPEHILLIDESRPAHLRCLIKGEPAF
jgi:hypothetical protein